jgi:hypothetical protein
LSSHTREGSFASHGPVDIFFVGYAALSPAALHPMVDIFYWLRCFFTCKREPDTTSYAEALLRLRGINSASEGSIPPLSDCFKALGLVVNTEKVVNREIKFGHTEERLRELFELIQNILIHNFIGNKTSEGCTAKRLKAATKVPSWHSRRTGPSIRIDDQLKSALGTLKNHRISSKNFSINRDLNEKWIIFTDGVFEPINDQAASLGGVLVCPNGRVV